MRQVQTNQRQRGNFESLIQSIEIEQTKEFGDVAVYYHLAKEFGLIEILDEAAGKRNQGVWVSFLTLIMAINRNVEPKSKRGILDWYRQTALPLITGIEAGVDFDYPGFLDTLDYWTDQAIAEAENQIFLQLGLSYGIKFSDFIWDVT